MSRLRSMEDSELETKRMTFTALGSGKRGVKKEKRSGGRSRADIV